MSEIKGVSKVSSGVEISVSNNNDKYPFNSKTFWVAIVCIALGVYLITIDNKDTGMQLILLGLGLLGVRDAIKKVERK